MSVRSIAKRRSECASRRRPGPAFALGALVLALPPLSLAAAVPLSPDGTISVPAFVAPPGTIVSKELVASRVEHVMGERTLAGLPIDEVNARLFGPRLELSKQKYKVKITAGVIAGVPVLTYEPANGVAPAMQGRVLLNVHGGGFNGCFVECGGLEAVPMASLTGGKVVSIDYREGPGSQFPQASQDVAAVYREVLKTTDPKHVVLFGCSAGGSLTGQALAWFQREGLPTPAAAGIFCAGADNPSKSGDSRIIGALLGDAELSSAASAATAAAASAAPRGGYMRTASPSDPTAYPANDPQVLAKFPPTLVVVGSRDFAFSGAIHLHSLLVANGVDARLHVWEGGRHAFFYDVRPPESGEAHRVMAKFFVDHMK